MAPISYRQHRFPAVVIQHTVWLYLRFTLSYRDVEELLAERLLDLSYVVFVRRADNQGEGGTMALISLALPAAGSLRAVLLIVGLAGASLFFGDAMDHAGDFGPERDRGAPDRDASIHAVCCGRGVARELAGFPAGTTACPESQVRNGLTAGGRWIPSRQPGAPIRKGSGSFGINAKYPRGIGPNYGDLMPAPDRIQAAVFTVLQTSMSDT